MRDKIPILRATRKSFKRTEDIVVTEFHLTIILNDREFVTLLCSPEKLDFLAIGFLFSEGLITSKGEIQDIDLDTKGGLVKVTTREPIEFPKNFLYKRVIASSGGKGASFFPAAYVQPKIVSQLKISPTEILSLVEKFVHRSQLFETTGGVHLAALCDAKSILVFSEDIGRHNAIDKVFGECLLKDIRIHDRLLLTSGRVSSEIVLKAGKRKIPILVSKSAPTNLGVKLADDLGIMLIGFVRENRMNVYTYSERLVHHAK